MKLDYEATIKNHLGEEVKFQESAEESAKPKSVKDVIYFLGSIGYQGQIPDEKVKIGEACWLAVDNKDLESEHISALKNCAKQVYNPIIMTSIIKALEGGAASK